MEMKDRQKLAYEGIAYSTQRIDLLTISLSGAGIYACLETFKYLNDKCLDINCIIKITGILFLIAIILNFISQIYGSKSNEQDYLMCGIDISAGGKDKMTQKDKISFALHDDKSERYSVMTNIFTYTSVGFMFVGLILLMTYYTFIF